MNFKTIGIGLLSLVLCWLGAAPARAQDAGTERDLPAFELAAQAPGRIDVGTRMGVLVDRSRGLSSKQVKAATTQWQTVTRASPNFGFTSDAYWFRFRLDNREQTDIARFIELPITFINDVQLYHYAGGALKTSYALGNARPFAQRPVKHQSFVMPLSLAPGANLIYIRLASAGTIEAPFRIWTPTGFYEANDQDKMLQGVVIGILLIMVLYNLFVLYATRDLNYLYYIGFVASYLLFHLSLNGYGFAYLWPDDVSWNSFAISTFIASTAMFTCLFTASFLRLSEFSRPAYYLLQGLSVASAVMLVLSFVIPYSVSVRVGAALVIPVAGIALALGYWRWWRGAKFARLYCVAWTALLISLIVLDAGKFGLIPTNAWTENAPQLGIVIMVLLLSFTLADRINSDRMLRIHAQSAALAQERKARASQQALMQAKEQANLELEQRVTERTLDLNTTLDELKMVNDKLQRLSTTDGLTQISNRAAFDSALGAEWRRASRDQYSLALIMLDIDHFKQVNDVYGHSAGDACLRALAQLLRPRIQRAGDVVARYGGEEFVILLLDTRLKDALALAEKLRTDIEKLEVEFAGKVIRFSASMGVACGVPDSGISPEEFLTKADKALYQAKNDGRNCVRFAALTSLLID